MPTTDGGSADHPQKAEQPSPESRTTTRRATTARPPNPDQPLTKPSSAIVNHRMKHLPRFADVQKTPASHAGHPSCRTCKTSIKPPYFHPAAPEITLFLVKKPFVCNLTPLAFCHLKKYPYLCTRFWKPKADRKQFQERW